MRLQAIFVILAATVVLAGMADVARAQRADSPPAVVIFAPDAIAGTANDGAAAFTPDGSTVVFMRDTGSGSTLMESQREHGRWSAPRTAAFSGHWHDLDPSMAPDGSFLLFVSNRPATPGGPPIDAIHAGKRRAGQGMNLWRVNRQGNHWGAPVRLPDTVNVCSLISSPSIAADGSIYFIGCAGPNSDFKLLQSSYRDGHYAAPCVVALGDTDATIRDPAIAPDRSFIVVSVKHAAQGPYRLAIAFRTPNGWSTPRDLGGAVNGGESMGAQLGPDHRTLYFYSDRRLPPSDPNAAATWNNGADHIWRVSLAPWLDAPSGKTSAASRPFPVEPAWGLGDDASPAFTPDGRTVVFARGLGLSRRIYLSHRQAGVWSAPERASFSNQWMDLEPVMAPDGSYLLFISNRPVTAGGKALDGYFGGKPQPGRGGNLWRVNREGHGWGTPMRLPDIVNTSPATYSPAVAADGSLYFMRPDPQSHHLRIYFSQFAGGRFQPPVRLPLPSNEGATADVDPAIAPDKSFIVFSSNRKPAAADANDLFLAFATPAGWGQPIHLGPSGEEARLDPDLSTLYFTAADNRIHRLSLRPSLTEHMASRSR